MRILAAFFGVCLLVVTMNNVGRDLVAPRGKISWLFTVTWRFWRAILRHLPGAGRRYAIRDRSLAHMPALVLLSRLLAWLLGLLGGFTLLAYGVTPGLTWATAARDVASCLLTLGFAVPYQPQVSVVCFLAAVSGPVLIALQIAYLPSMYAAYSRREALVTLCWMRGGEPAWGPDLLARQCLAGANHQLRSLYHQWEIQAADISESHSNYPILMVFRSPHPYRSWIVALLAVMDAAAMHLACAPNSAPVEARLVLRAGFLALRQIANARHIPFDPDPRPGTPITLTFAQFRDGVQRVADAGFTLERPVVAAWPHFQGWRVNYEQIAYEIARRTDAVPAPWSGPRDWPAVTIHPERPPNPPPGRAQLRLTADLADRLHRAQPHPATRTDSHPARARHQPTP